MDLKFYKCMHCGNIAIKPFDAGVPLVCCGEKMTELTANTTDAAVEKHVRGARRPARTCTSRWAARCIP